MKTVLGNKQKILSLLKSFSIRRGLTWGIIIIGALLAFEMFNFSTTQFALNDVLGDLKFVGISWATILALAFCGIDFAGIARLFTPEEGRDEAAEVWYLFGAWLLAAAMNATLTWWGVSIAISSHPNLSSEIISSTVLIKVVPIFVAIMVWLIRVLIIGTFSIKGGKLFSQAESHKTFRPKPTFQPAIPMSPNNPRPVAITPLRPAGKAARSRSSFPHSEATYSSLAFHGKPVHEAEYIETPRNS